MTDLELPAPLSWSCPREDCLTQITTLGDDVDLVQERHDVAVAEHRKSHRGQPVVPLELTDADEAIAAAAEAELERVAGS